MIKIYKISIDITNKEYEVHQTKYMYFGIMKATKKNILYQVVITKVYIYST